MPAPIVCITPNTALDRTLIVPGFGAGGVFRPRQTLVAAGGKGVNVARVVQRLGGVARCAGFLAGHTGHLVAELAQQEGLPAAWTLLDSGATRVCTILVDDAAGRVSVVNEAGPPVNAADWARLNAAVTTLSAGAAAVCWCGSLPPGAPVDAFAAGLRALVAAGPPVYVDTSGDALRAALDVPGVCIKINLEEAAELLQLPAETPAAAQTAARHIQARTAAPVVITLGAAGAVLLTATGSAWQAVPPPVAALSAVGSGDSFLGALVLALAGGQPPEAALSRAVAAGAANTLTIGGGVFSLEAFHAVLAQVRVSAG
ncbi:MAG: hexose kinase [Anaerolineae bacterium]|nr:hexose kinase [Anaerolineae bacterium]